MSRVFILHEPVSYDRQERRMVPIDLSPAKKFGDLHIVFPGHDRPPPIADCADALKVAMATFTAADRLLIAGDIDLVVFAAILAAKACNGHLTLLKWHTRDRCYFEVAAPSELFSN